MEELLSQYVDLATVRKLGEGTFGEAFKASSQVLKIVPMEGQLKVNGEEQKKAEDMLGEVAITKTLSALHTGGQDAPNSTTGFVRAFGVGLGRGAYPPALAAEWHRWDEEFESENDPVDAFGPDQLFTTALTLAVAEEAAEFEHRDLHWGNLLIKPTDRSSQLTCRLRGVDILVQTEGVLCTLIDFTLSRLRTSSGALAFCNLAADPELFAGPRANTQAEAYRRMRKLTNNSWEGHEPGTNAVWLHYLADTCLTYKLGSCTHTNADKVALRGFRKRALGYASASEVVWDEYFKGCWSTA